MARNNPEPIQQFRGTTTAVAAYTGPVGEIVIDTDKNTVVVQDGVTAGGHYQAKDSDVVHRTGDETVGGQKTFTSVVQGVTPDSTATGTELATAAWVRSLTGSGGVSAGDGITITDGVVSINEDYLIDQIDTFAPANVPGDGITINGTEIAVDSTVVRTSGNQEIVGTKTFYANIYCENNRPYIEMGNTGVTAYTAPTEIQYWGMRHYDSNGLTVGSVYTRVRPDGFAGVFLQAHSYVEGGSIALLGLDTEPSGAAYGVCPTPAYTDDASHIATTEWVREWNRREGLSFNTPASVTVYVDGATGVDEIGAGTEAQPFKTVEYAVSYINRNWNASRAYYVVNIRPGVYIPNDYMFLIAPTTYSSVTFQRWGDSGDVEFAAALDVNAGNTGSPIRFVNITFLKAIKVRFCWCAFVSCTFYNFLMADLRAHVVLSTAASFINETSTQITYAMFSTAMSMLELSAVQVSINGNYAASMTANSNSYILIRSNVGFSGTVSGAPYAVHAGSMLLSNGLLTSIPGTGDGIVTALGRVV